MSALPEAAIVVAMKTILQIVPRAPGEGGGVSDYALNLARYLRRQHQLGSIFVAPRSAARVEDFPVFAPVARVLDDTITSPAAGVILHYVNYGYHDRGVPLDLLRTLRLLRRRARGKLVVIFHELYASGPPWKSEFWLRPLQKKIACDIARLADVRLVSSESMRAELANIFSPENIFVHPVPSSFGELVLDEAQLRQRDPHSWIICGGTSLLERSLHSFMGIIGAISAENAPRNLVLLGGTRNARVENALRSLADVRCEYWPHISPEEASAFLARGAFAWLDYFHRADVPADFLLKSSSFASLCAHGVIPVAPALAGKIAVNGDVLSAPFTPYALPPAPARAQTAFAIHCWYQRHAALPRLAECIRNIFAP